MSRYALGIDFGSLSARAVLVRVADGAIIDEFVCQYAHGIIEGEWNGAKLQDGVFLQVPGDFLAALGACVKGVLHTSQIDPKDIIAVGVDGTSATVIPCEACAAPLANNPRYASSPYAQALMWKSRSSQTEVDDMIRSAKKHDEPFLRIAGGNIPSNSGVPKILHLLRNAPEVYHATERYYDLCDWIVCQLTGCDAMNGVSASGKFLYTAKYGWPSEAFFADLDESMRHFIRDKMPPTLLAANQIAGTITEYAAALTGLAVGTPVAAGMIDGIGPLPAVGVSSPGKLMFVIGTSAAGCVLADTLRPVRGLYSAMDAAPYAGLYTYETGLQSFGDTLSWYVTQCCPESVSQAGNVFDVLSRQAEAISPCESGLLVMNWWNGNRSVLVDGDLSGCILGLTLKTKPAEIFRALVEAMAFNFRMIKDAFQKESIPIDEIIAIGGIPKKNRFIMQLIADIMGCPITVPDSAQASALGTAIFAAWAVGSQAGGYDTVEDAISHMGVKQRDEYFPDMEIHAKYRELYSLYVELCEDMSRNGGPIKRLNAFKRQA